MIFTLRTVSKRGTVNRVIGGEYNHICRFQNYEEFQGVFKKYFEKNHIADNDSSSDSHTKKCYGFLIYDGASIIHPLFKDETYFIVNENGKTFEKLN